MINDIQKDTRNVEPREDGSYLEELDMEYQRNLEFERKSLANADSLDKGKKRT